MTRLVLFTGKGGVGKTTTAAATALHAACSGVATLVLSAGPAHSLADVLAVRLGPEPIEVSAGLFAAELHPRARAERGWPLIRRQVLGALDDLGVEALSGQEFTELPLADDVFALLELRDHLREDRWGLVILDCAGSGETMRLLAAPERLAQQLQRLLPMERRITRLIGPPERANDPLVEAVERLGAELAELQQMLHAASTSIRLVLTPESLALADTRRTWTALALHALAVDVVLVNRLQAAADSDDPSPRGRLRAQEEVLTAVETSFASIPVQRCRSAAAEPIGLRALAELADLIYGPAGEQAAAALLAAPPTPKTIDVHPESDGYVLRLPLPLADRANLDLGRRGDHLVVTVEGRRRVLPLPSGLRRCQVEGAVLRDGALSIRFVPDPAQWRPV